MRWQAVQLQLAYLWTVQLPLCLGPLPCLLFCPFLFLWLASSLQTYPHHVQESVNSHLTRLQMSVTSFRRCLQTGLCVP